MTEQRLQIDLPKGIDAGNRICAAFRAGSGVFEDTSDILEHQIPAGVEPRSRAHANFLFFLIPQDHGVKSRHLYARAKALHRATPNLFEPSWVASHHSPDTVGDLAEVTGRQLGTRYPNETGRQWYRNAVRLSEQYGGDARSICARSKDGPDMLRRLREFRGFGPKTGALAFRTFTGCGFCRLPGWDEVPIPVDIHDTRIAFLVGLVSPTPTGGGISAANYMRYARIAQRAWIQVSKHAGLDWLELDRALWLLGSRGCQPDRYFSCCIVRNCARTGDDGGTRNPRDARGHRQRRQDNARYAHR